MDIETKLRRFSESVRKEAESQNEIKNSELDKKYNSSVKEFEKKANIKYKEMANDALIQAEKLKQKKISDANANVKRMLMQTRADYVDKVFGNILKRLDGYFKSPEYEQLIIDCIESYKSICEEKSGITAQLMERDKALVKSIEDKCGIKISTVDEDFLGGVRIILDKSRVADCTMRPKFEAEKARFNKIKIL